MRRAPILAVTPGDPQGIGPEISVKAWKALGRKKSGPKLLFIGAAEPFAKLGVKPRLVDPTQDLLRQFQPGKFHLIPAPKNQLSGPALQGYQSGWSVARAVEWIQSGLCDALVTGPIHKGHLNAGGYPYPGHTELLADLTRSGPVTMMLANRDLRVAMVTTHIGLAQVSSSLRIEKVRDTLLRTLAGLRQYWGIQKPRVALCALNPHAGEGGLFGTEESSILEPAIRLARAQAGGQVEILGPLPSDTLFAVNHLQPAKKRLDAVVCLYHDQGLIPVKLLDFRGTVNLTLGLPIIRTSVDHGVAFDIAGKNRADPASLLAAIQLAERFVKTVDRTP